MFRKHFILGIFVFGLMASHAFGQAAAAPAAAPAGAQAWPAPPPPSFSTAGLVKVGDSVRFSSYEVIKIGEGIFEIKDQGDPRSRAGGLIGADMYMVTGTNKALLIDLGNNYMLGYKGDEILPRKDAKEDFLTIVDGLAGKLPVEATITHAHPDHDGMTMALIDRKVTVWVPKGENMEAPRTQHGIDPAVYTIFDQQTKTWDLGGGRVVTPFMVRGHSNGCSVYILHSDDMMFSGDCLGIGAGRSLGSAAALKVWTEDTAKLVEYIKANFGYERYGLKVYTGHSVENVIPGFLNINHTRLDLSYLDWRFVQDQARCGDAIMKGQWLNPESGLRYQEVVNSQNRRQVSLFTYGIGAVEMPVAQAYIAAGIKQTEPAPAK